MFWKKQEKDKKAEINKKTAQAILKIWLLVEEWWGYIWLFGNLGGISSFGLLRSYGHKIPKTLELTEQWVNAAELTMLDVQNWAEDVCQTAGIDYERKLEKVPPSDKEVAMLQRQYQQTNEEGRYKILKKILDQVFRLEDQWRPLLKEFEAK